MSAQPETKVRYEADQLSKLMNRKDTLAGWDVLVSYEQTALNKLLAAQHDKVGTDKTTIKEFDVKYKDEEDKEQVSVYNLSLGKPSMKILDHQASVQIDFPLSGTTTRKSSGTVVSFPPGLFLKCNTRLVTLRGESGTTVPNDPSDAKLAGGLVAFEPSKSDGHFVAIKLTNVDVEIGDENGNDSVLSALISAPLKNHLYDSGIVYYLTGVNNNNPTTEGVNLKPSKFLVTSMMGDESEKSPNSYLLTWISLEGSTSTPKENADNSPLIFTVDDTNQISPVPAGYTASVIFSHDTFYKYFIKENLTKGGFTEITDLSNFGFPETIEFSAKVSSNVVEVEEIEDKGKNRCFCEGVKFDMNEEAAVFSFDRGKARLYFQKNVDGVRYGGYELTTDIEGFSDYRLECGKATFKFRIEGSGDWDSSGDSLALTINVPSRFDVDVSAEDPGWYYRVFGGGRADHIFDAMKNVSATVDSIEFDFGGIDFFLTTNLLSPNKTVFTADSAVKGLFTPRDVLLCGNIVPVNDDIHFDFDGEEDDSEVEEEQSHTEKEDSDEENNKSDTEKRDSNTEKEDSDTEKEGSNTEKEDSGMEKDENASSTPESLRQGISFQSITMSETSRTDSNVQDKKPSLRTFVSDLCRTDPPSELRKALMPFFLSGHSASQEDFETTMQKFGYGAITQEELQQLIGLSSIPGETAATPESHPEVAGLDTTSDPVNGPSELQTSSDGEDVQFDAGAFGGLYKVSSANPPVREIFISSTTAQLQMGNKWYSTTSSRESDGSLKLFWSDQTSNYAITLKSFHDTKAEILRVVFTGSRSTFAGEQSDFNGELASRPLRATDKVLQAGGGMDTFLVIAAIVGFIAAIPALMFYITCLRKASEKCRGRERIATEQGKKAEAEAARKQREAIQDIVEIVVQKLQQRSEPNLKGAIQRHIRENLSPERREALLQDLRYTIEQCMREWYQSRPDPEQILDPTRIDPELNREIMDRVEGVGRTWTNANMGAEAMRFAQGFGEGTGMDPSTVERLAQESIELERIQTLDQLVTGNYREIIQGNIADLINRLNIQNQETNIRRWDDREPNNVNNHNEARSRLEAALQVEAEFSKREPPQEGNAKQEYEREKQKIEDEVRHLADNERRERETLDNERQKRLENENKRQELEKEKVELENRRTEAERKFREGK